MGVAFHAGSSEFLELSGTQNEEVPMSAISPYFQIPGEASWELWTTVLRRSAIDPEYRARLLADPRAAIQEETGFELPAGYRVQFAEKPEGVDDLIVLPNLIPDAAELTEEELEAIAGGNCTVTCTCSACSQSCAVTSGESTAPVETGTDPTLS
jgi:hypothetical protein